MRLGIYRLFKITPFIFFAILQFINPDTSFGQTYESSMQGDKITLFKDFFDKDEPVELTLEFDLKTFQRERINEKYIDAMLYYNENDSTRNAFPVRLKTRGVFRKSYCYLPPFWININKSGINTDELDNIKKMKVVTHCMKLKNYQDYVLKEYLAYKVYNIISPYSFKVRLLKIKYIDTGRKNKEIEGWAFVIEPIELVADRLDARIVENMELAMARMNPGIMDRLAIYNYMIGNTDFSITGLHNIKLLMLNHPGPTGYIPIPYDFDYTGFVNTSYAKPAENTPVDKVTERYFMGMCRPDRAYETVVEEFKNQNHDILQLLQSFEYMSLDQKLEMLRFIEEFHSEIAREDFVESRLKGSCK